MKKIVSILLIIILFSSLITTSAEENITVYVNTEDKYTVSPTIILNDRTFISIGDINKIFGYDFKWIEEHNHTEIFDDENLLILPVDKYEYTFNNKTEYTDICSRIYKEEILVPLRLVAEAFGHKVLWDEEKRAVNIIKKTDYIDDDFKTLKELEIITDEDIKKGGYITYAEAFDVLTNLGTGVRSNIDLKIWYFYDYYQPLDYLDDEKKAYILSLNSTFRNRIFTDGDFENFDFEENLTWNDALKYAIRIIGNTYGCSDESMEVLYYHKTEEIFDIAYKKGLIDEIKINTANDKITREEFYTLINKTIYVEYSHGGYVTTTRQHINDIINYKKNAKKDKPDFYQNEQWKPIYNEITPEITFNDNCTVSWNLPKKYSYLGTDEYTLRYSFHDEDQNISFGGLFSGKKEINIKDYLKYFIKYYPIKITHISCTYEKKSGSNQRWHFDIDLTNIITIEEKGESLTPGIIIRKSSYNNDFESMTLTDGNMFKKDTYYMLTSKDNSYRKDEYNSTLNIIIFSENDTEEIKFKNFSIFPTEIKIREISYSYENGKHTIYLTPLSDSYFNIQIKQQ